MSSNSILVSLLLRHVGLAGVLPLSPIRVVQQKNKHNDTDSGRHFHNEQEQRGLAVQIGYFIIVKILEFISLPHLMLGRFDIFFPDLLLGIARNITSFLENSTISSSLRFLGLLWFLVLRCCLFTTGFCHLANALRHAASRTGVLRLAIVTCLRTTATDWHDVCWAFIHTSAESRSIT